ncbi:SubName: Full=Related to CDC28-Cyclin-dependent protein kinase {ECO:0000313/EMBL:CCA68031.1} [Serendipita indica DSM 11827]|nr:SubName: Full=Related to CDC28-Cyclin-dependent protein kinase {ECO:0000313/EMBL:CCA68031.1} [Serendipita indica DSM 11827]
MSTLQAIIRYEPAVYADAVQYLIVDRPFGSRIYRAVYTNDPGEVLAVKVVPAHVISYRKPHNIRNEAAILSKLSHPNIVYLRSAFYDSEKELYELHLAMIELPLDTLLDHPYFSSHSLPDGLHISTPNPFPAILPELLHSSVVRSLAYQLISGTEYIHSLQVAHRDINPGNILLTTTGILKLVDFGVAWDPSISPFSIVGEESVEVEQSKESLDDMCAQIATGHYRAPELMYTPKHYNACATDLWSLGITLSTLFTPLRLQTDEQEEEEDNATSSSETSEDIPILKVEPYIFPRKPDGVPPHATWRRDPIFDASRGEIALLWSIFKVLGTPTKETWPDFPGHQEGAGIQFIQAPRQDIAKLMPHLPPADPNPLNLIEALLAYPPSKRLSASKARVHSWFMAGEPLLFPTDYSLEPAEGTQTTNKLQGFTLTQILHYLVDVEHSRFLDTTHPRSEWD